MCAGCGVALIERRNLRAEIEAGVDARFLQAGGALPAGAGVGVDHADGDGGDARADEGIRTGRGDAVMGAGFQRDKGVGAARALPCPIERLSFSVGAAAIGGGGLADHIAVADEDAADRRVWSRAPGLCAGEIEGGEEVVH